MKKIYVALAALCALLTAASALAATMHRFDTQLSGNNEVPALTSEMTGKFKLRLDEDGNQGKFTLRVKKGHAVTMAHLHCGQVGQNGPVVATLVGEVPGGFDVSGQLAAFTLKDANVVSNTCNPAITNIDQLSQAAREGKIYVNVHTVAHPGGEIRGQVTAK